MQVVSVFVHYFSQNYLVAMATSLDKSENEFQIDHLHPKRFHMVKRLRKSVHYIRRYSIKYASFFCHVEEDAQKWALSTLELLDQSSRNFYTIEAYIEASFTLLMRTLR